MYAWLDPVDTTKRPEAGGNIYGSALSPTPPLRIEGKPVIVTLSEPLPSVLQLLTAPLLLTEISVASAMLTITPAAGTVVGNTSSVAIASNVFQQVNYLNKPIIFVNRQNFYGSGKKLVEENKLRKIKNYKFGIHRKILKQYKDSEMVVTQLWKDHIKFYGVDTNIKNLSYYLKDIKKLTKYSFRDKIEKTKISKYVGIKCYLATFKEINKFVSKQKIVNTNKSKVFFYKIIFKILMKIYLVKITYF